LTSRRRGARAASLGSGATTSRPRPAPWAPKRASRARWGDLLKSDSTFWVFPERAVEGVG